MIGIFAFSLASDSGEESEVDESELNFLNVSYYFSAQIFHKK